MRGPSQTICYASGSIDCFGSYLTDLREQSCIFIYIAKGRCEESKSLINPNDIQNAPMMTIITKYQSVVLKCCTNVFFGWVMKKVYMVWWYVFVMLSLVKIKQKDTFCCCCYCWLSPPCLHCTGLLAIFGLAMSIYRCAMEVTNIYIDATTSMWHLMTNWCPYHAPCSTTHPP
jgi:hypothetical protein